MIDLLHLPRLLLLLVGCVLAFHAASCAEFARDAENQLTSVSYVGSRSVSYTYDPSGNITGVTVINGDSDSDGLSDAWETQYFGNLSRDGTGDFDSDGVSDALEFRAGTNPASNQSLFRIITISGNPSSGVYLEWLSGTNKFYTVERKSDLAAPFTPIELGIFSTPPTNTFTDLSATNAGGYFYRLRLD